jgi:hypothetical protein
MNFRAIGAHPPPTVFAARATRAIPMRNKAD